MLRIGQHGYESLRRHGEQTYPHECCGVLLGVIVGDVRQVREVVPAGNARLDALHNRYSIDPAELVRIQRQARERELDIVGFYHSHPDHPARWSPTDLAEAHWIGCSYVITAVEHGRATQTNSFALTGETEESKHFVDEEIKILTTEDTEDTEAAEKLKANG